MPVGKRYKVRCGICGSTFNKDYTSKHCRTSHPSYNVDTLPTTVCREPDQSTLSTLFGIVSHVQEQVKQPSRSPPKDTQSEQSLDEEHEPEAPVEFEEVLLREVPGNNPQSKIVQQNEMTSDEEMLDGPSPVHLNMNRDDQVDKTTSHSSDSDTENTDTVTFDLENDTECWITCYGKLRHLTSTMGECQELLSTADNADAPNPKHLLGNLVDVVQRINYQSSSLLEMAVSELTKLDAATDEEKSNNPVDYSPSERDPARRRNIMYDADRICLIEQGPFQPKLTHYRSLW